MNYTEWNDEHMWCTEEEITAETRCNRCLDGDCDDCENCQEGSKDDD